MEEEDLDLFLTDIYGKFGQEIPDATKIQTIKDTYGDDYKDIPELKEALILLKKSKDLLKKIIEED